MYILHLALKKLYDNTDWFPVSGSDSVTSLTGAEHLGGLLSVGPRRPLLLFELQLDAVRLGRLPVLEQSLVGPQPAVGRRDAALHLVQLDRQLREMVALLQLRPAPTGAQS